MVLQNILQEWIIHTEAHFSQPPPPSIYQLLLLEVFKLRNWSGASAFFFFFNPWGDVPGRLQCPSQCPSEVSGVSPGTTWWMLQDLHHQDLVVPHTACLNIKDWLIHPFVLPWNLHHSLCERFDTVSVDSFSAVSKTTCYWLNSNLKLESFQGFLFQGVSGGLSPNSCKHYNLNVNLYVKDFENDVSVSWRLGLVWLFAFRFLPFVQTHTGLARSHSGAIRTRFEGPGNQTSQTSE